MKRDRSEFWFAIALICASFAAYELWLNLHLRAVNDDVVAACAPVHVMGGGEIVAAR